MIIKTGDDEDVIEAAVIDLQIKSPMGKMIGRMVLLSTNLPGVTLSVDVDALTKYLTEAFPR